MLEFLSIFPSFFPARRQEGSYNFKIVKDTECKIIMYSASFLFNDSKQAIIGP